MNTVRRFHALHITHYVLRFFVLLFSILFLTLPAFAQTPATEKPVDAITYTGPVGKRGGKLVLPIEGMVKTFNPYYIEDSVTRKVLSQKIFSSLVSYDLITMQPQMDLAKSIDISDDGLIYTVKLRQGLKWSDGTPLTADDVVFSYNVLDHKTVVAAAREMFAQEDGTIPHIEKIDTSTVQFKLKTVNVQFYAALYCLYIVPKHKLETALNQGEFAHTWNISTPPSEIVSSGPYKVKEIVADQRLVFERNPYFYKYDTNGVQLPYLDKIIRLMTPNFEATLIRFENQETDMHEVRPEEYDRLKKSETSASYTMYDLGPDMITYWMYLNLNPGTNRTGKPYVNPSKLKVFSDKRFRQALSYAIDREGLVKTVFYGRAIPAYQIVSAGEKTWFNPNTKTYPFSLDQARKLLADMGLKDANGDGYLDLDTGEPVSFVMNTNVENHTRIQIGNTIKEDFAKIGIKAELQPVPFNNLLTAQRETFDYEAIIMGWVADVPPDPLSSKNVLMSSGPLHCWYPQQKKPATPWEAEIDQLMIQNQTTLDMAKRKRTYNRVQEIIAEEQPQIYIATPIRYVAIKNKFGNVKPVVARPYFDWNVDEIYDKTIP